MINEGRSLNPVPGNDPANRFCRRRLGSAAAGLLAATLAAPLGWLAAKSRTDRSAAPDGGANRGTASPLLRVTGASMAPTLAGMHTRLRCAACGVAWIANWQPGLRPAAAVICWNCGARVPIQAAVVQSGSRVRLEPLDRRYRPRSGDLVAIRLPPVGDWPAIAASHDLADDGGSSAAARLDRQISVKRIVAGPGQRITHRRGRLLVDGAPVPSPGVWIPVHDDSYRREGQSWWEPQRRAGEAATVHRTEQGFKLRAQRGDADDTAPRRSHWLIYHHRSVHNGMRPDVIRDDVPGNVSEVRVLLPVDSLRLSFQIAKGASGSLEIALWDGATPTIHRVALSSEATQLQFATPCQVDGRGSDDAAPAVDPKNDPFAGPAALAGAERPALGETTPIAIRVISGSAELSQIRLARPLQYTIDHRLAAQLSWPIALAADAFFVLGDNVPLSVDSRHFGPLARERIVGRIEPVS